MGNNMIAVNLKRALDAGVLLEALSKTYSVERLDVLKETVLRNSYIPHLPTIKQAIYLMEQPGESFYGGAAGGGKSDALLMAALQYVTVPTYSALLLRKTFSDLSLPGALIPRSHEWLSGTDAVWSAQEKRWTFPSGATLSFGYLDSTGAEYRYQSSEFQYIGFDELTQFHESQYTYLFSRLRKLKGHDVPLRMCSASNPGNIGHDWVKARFIQPSDLSGLNRVFIPARLEDNPYIDMSYEDNLNRLDPVTRQQLREGDWDVQLEGNFFKRQDIHIINDKVGCPKYVRFWDLAGTEAKRGKDPDYTVGVLLAYKEGRYHVQDVVRVREEPGVVESIIRNTATADGPNVSIGMEQEPGSSGKGVIDHYARVVLPGYSFVGVRATGNKLDRARGLSAACSQGNLYVLSASWTAEFINELCAFPNGAHDDQVDALSGAFNLLFSYDDSRFMDCVVGGRGYV